MADTAPPGGTAPPIRDAATVILLREGKGGPSVLMGQRGAGAAFMPSKYVFPGGAVDAADARAEFAAPIGRLCADRLALAAPAGLAHALAAAALRELWEETGLLIGAPGNWRHPVPAGWELFAGTGHLPDASALTYFFRAITPPGRPRRFDARFFLADVSSVVGDPDDFSRACDELGHLHWVPLSAARELNLPFITEVVLGEVEAMTGVRRAPTQIPFFDNSGDQPVFRSLA